MSPLQPRPPPARFLPRIMRLSGMLTLGLSSLLLLAPVQAQEVEQLPAAVFREEAPLQVRMEAPFSNVLASRGEEADYFPATLFYTEAPASEVAVPLRIKTRGNFRNRKNVCRFPPLMLNFPRSALGDTLFAGENRLKLVTHCQPRSQYLQYVLLEYLSYRVLNLVTEFSMRVRLLDISYLDSESGRTVASAPGFLLEDSAQMGARLQRNEVRLRRLERSWYDPQQEVLVALFQYLLGNTDWSLIVGDPGDVCCHNVYPLEGLTSALVPVPYDFDVTGLVDPRYGSAPRQLGLRRLTQRLYRGACPAPADLQEAVALFVDKRAQIRALFEHQEGLNETVRRRALNYIEAFYEVITDHEQVEEKIRGACIR